MDLMEKVRQVGENYELNKYKALNKTVELDARLANDRLLATKLRLSQVCSLNDKLGKQVRLIQQQYAAQEKKLLLAETMLRQLIDGRSELATARHGIHYKGASSKQTPNSGGGSRLSRLRSRSSKATKNDSGSGKQDKSGTALTSGVDQGTATSGGGGQLLSAAEPNARAETAAMADPKAVVSSSGASTQRSRAKTIISDLRQRLNFVGSKGECHRYG